ncbi:DUF3099 domain-containing protein [Leucobacter luti]|uniref:DUF3099 family protein n=1 Tax=Leucobacter luti TaxID=340320 RepID=A0A4Q7TKS0_9MICO|nr:DUF3099 domain-containing protein [Leucobacter luti]MBL3700283.1 DUF3099 domain-containing protein [Leucobacter luti]RZT60993.1 DUF3099 family protein [Leucobacter luti]
MAKSYSVTSAGVSPAEDRAHRMRMYFIAMILRVLCVVSLFWVRGWWILLVAAGAVILPWFAVMVGNAVAHNPGEAPDAPEPQQLTAPETAPEAQDPASELIVVDVEPARRSAGATGSSAAAGGAGGADDAHSGAEAARAPEPHSPATNSASHTAPEEREA